jgi:superfamily II DNA or RNA helicase
MAMGGLAIVPTSSTRRVGAQADDGAHASPKARYKLKRRIAVGTDSAPEIWRARDTRLRCDVIVKRYGVELSDACERELALLRSGAPHVPSLIDAYTEDGGAIQTVVRSLTPGIPLDQMAGIAAGQAMRVAADVARLFHSLHTMKPVGFALGDAVAADIVRDEHDNLWLIRAEEARPIDQVGTKDDIRAAGLIALTILCGAGSPGATIEERLEKLPESVAAVIEHAIDPAPEGRYASAQWLAQALDELAARNDDQRSNAASPIPAPARPIFRAVRMNESVVAHALGKIEQSSSLDWLRLAHDGLLLDEVEDESGLTALDTLDIDCYPHQMHAAASVVTNVSMDAGAILADEVGLGKTIEALIICQELRARGLAESVLIVASPSGAAQWVSEARLRIRRNAYEQGFRLYQSAKDAGYPLLIVSSATLKQDRRLAQLLDRRFDLVIVDEAHQCCAGSGKLSTLGRAVSRLDRRRMLLLTATPLGNRLWDLYTLADLIRPGMLGTAKQFAAEFVGDSASAGFSAEAAIRKLRAKMQALMVRHRRSELRDVVTPAVDCRIDQLHLGGSTKIATAADLISGQWRNERVVVFARNPAHRQALAKELAGREPKRVVIVFQSGRRHGRGQERQFNEYAAAVVISGDTVAEGMNWQRARCMLHLDAPLSPIVWEQRLGRIFRLGQRADRIEIVHLTMAGSAEAKVYNLFSDALGLFTLPIGEASVVLDYLADARLRNLEGPIRLLMREADPDGKLFKTTAGALSAARLRYDRNTTEAALLDDIYFGGGAF